MNQSIVGNNSAYSAADLENKTVVITGNNLLNETEIIKDRGSEKHHHKEFDDNINKTNEFMDILPDNYQTETVDFPDSPKYRKFSEYSQSSQGQINEKEMEKASRDFLTSESEQIPKQNCSINLNSSGNLRKKKISVNRDILASDEHDDDDQKSFSSLSNKSDADVFSPIDDLITPDDIETPEELNESVFECAGSSLSEPIPEFSAAEELEEERSWKTCIVGGVKRNIDMKVIEPYKKVLSHGGYFGSTRNAIIVFSACYLPDRSRRDYDYVMDNLFLYVLVTLDQLVAEDYVLIYLHGATQRSNMPSFGWLKRCYQMIDRRLRKNLKGLYLVHPTFWLKTIVIMTRPFVSTKFSRKLQFVSTLQELSDLIPMDHVCIPDKVKQIEFQCIIKRKKKSMKNRSKQQYLTQ